MAEQVKALLSQLPSIQAVLRWHSSPPQSRPDECIGMLGVLQYPPFFAICGLLHAVDVKWMGTAFNTTFSLEPHELRKVVSSSDSKLMLHLTLFDDDTESIVAWPVTRGAAEVDVKMNGKLVQGQLDESGQFMPRQRFLQLKWSDLRSATNKVDLSLSKRMCPKDVDPGKWAKLGTLCVLLTRRVDISELLSVHSQSITTHTRSRGSQEVSMQVGISMRDPILKGKMTPPMVRGLQCEHLQCFDLGAWLRMALKRGTANFRWECPVCGLPLHWQDLCRDLAMEAYSKAHPDIECLMVDQERWGDPSYVPDQVTPWNDDSDDDDDSAIASVRKGAGSVSTTTDTRGAAKSRSARKSQSTATASKRAREDDDDEVVAPKKSTRRRKAAQPPAEVYASCMRTLEEHINLATQVTLIHNKLTREQCDPAKRKRKTEEIRNVLTELARLPTSSLNSKWICQSNLIVILKRIRDEAPEPQERRLAATLLEGWKVNVPGLKEEMQQKERMGRVEMWVDEQTVSGPVRKVIKYAGGPWEYCEGRTGKRDGTVVLRRMLQCPLFHAFYRPGEGAQHAKEVEAHTVKDTVVLTGAWVVDTLLGDCFQYSGGQQQVINTVTSPSQQPAPPPVQQQQQQQQQQPPSPTTQAHQPTAAPAAVPTPPMAPVTSMPAMPFVPYLSQPPGMMLPMMHAMPGFGVPYPSAMGSMSTVRPTSDAPALAMPGMMAMGGYPVYPPTPSTPFTTGEGPGSSSSQNDNARSSPARREEARKKVASLVCVACSKPQCTDHCQLCRGTEAEHDSPWVECPHCRRWVAQSCLGVRPQQWKSYTDSYCCPECLPLAPNLLEMRW